MQAGREPRTKRRAEMRTPQTTSLCCTLNCSCTSCTQQCELRKHSLVAIATPRPKTSSGWLVRTVQSLRPQRLLTDCTQQRILATNAHQSRPLCTGPCPVSRHLVPAPHPSHSTQPNLHAPFPYPCSWKTAEPVPAMLPPCFPQHRLKLSCSWQVVHGG